MIKELLKFHNYLYIKPYSISVQSGHIRVNPLCVRGNERLEKVFYNQCDNDLNQAVEYFESFLPYKPITDGSYVSSLFAFITMGGTVNLNGRTFYRDSNRFIIFNESDLYENFDNQMTLNLKEPPEKAMIFDDLHLAIKKWVGLTGLERLI